MISQVSLVPCPLLGVWVSPVPVPFQGVCLGGGEYVQVGAYGQGGYTHLSRTWDTMAYGRQAGSTDPTGMLSCFTGDCDTHAKDAARDSVDAVPTVVGLFGK